MGNAVHLILVIAVHQKEKDVNAAQQNAAIVNAVHLIHANAVHQKERVVNAVHQKERVVNAVHQNVVIVNVVHLIPVNAVHQKEEVVNAVHQKEKHVNVVHLKVILKVEKVVQQEDVNVAHQKAVNAVLLEVENSAQLKAMLAVPHKVVVVLLIKTKVPLQKDVILKVMDVVNYRNLINK